jgi:hypothetical protein
MEQPTRKRTSHNCKVIIIIIIIIILLLLLIIIIIKELVAEYFSAAFTLTPCRSIGLKFCEIRSVIVSVSPESLDLNPGNEIIKSLTHQLAGSQRNELIVTGPAGL